MFQNFTLRRRRISSAIVLSLLFIQILVPAQTLKASPQQDLREQAQRSYVRGEFDNTLQILRAFLQIAGITPSHKQDGLVLLAKTFIARGEPQAAKEVIKKF